MARLVLLFIEHRHTLDLYQEFRTGQAARLQDGAGGGMLRQLGGVFLIELQLLSMINVLNTFSRQLPASSKTCFILLRATHI